MVLVLFVVPVFAYDIPVLLGFMSGPKLYCRSYLVGPDTQALFHLSFRGDPSLGRHGLTVSFSRTSKDESSLQTGEVDGLRYASSSLFSVVASMR